MALKDLRESTPEALQRILLETEAKLRDLRSSLASHQLTNVREVRKMRLQIAQIKTVLKEKALASEKPAKSNL